MPRFNITAEFDLSTEIEPDLYGQFDRGQIAEEFSDDSNFDVGEVEVVGGRLIFTVEAEDEADAEEKADEVLSSGDEVTDRNGLTWLVCNVSIEVEPVEEPMTKERAKDLVGAWLSEQTLPGEVKEAFRFLLSEV